MSQKSPAFQWYPRDFMSSQRVMMMSLAEKGAYIIALNSCWLQGSIPADTDKLILILGRDCTPEIAAVVKSMFIPHPDDACQLIHERLEEERTKQEVHRKAKSRAGKNGAQKRWADNEADNSSAIVLPLAKNSSSSSSSSAPADSTNIKTGAVDEFVLPTDEITRRLVEDEYQVKEHVTKHHSFTEKQYETLAKQFVSEETAGINKLNKPYAEVLSHFKKWVKYNEVKLKQKFARGPVNLPHNKGPAQMVYSKPRNILR